MLTHLSVQNFTLVDALELELTNGMTAITGETGAGKSILVDALGLTLGDRADPDRVRSGRERADICATFDIAHIPAAQTWLSSHDLGDGQECLMRRVITREGRSRGYINGQPAPLGQLKELGEMLIDIHGQHAHQSLLKKETHRRLLDDFGDHGTLLGHCHQHHKDWQEAQRCYTKVRDNVEEITARTQLLRYQVQELDALALTEGELEQLEAEQRQLDSAGTIVQHSQQIAQLCEDEENGLLTSLHRALHLLGEINEKPQALQNAEELLTNAQIQAQEAQCELQHHINNFEQNPQRLVDVEERLSSAYDIARKHRINPEELLALHRTLSDELSQLNSADEQLDTLEARAQQTRTDYFKLARKLSKQRRQAAQKLQEAINLQLQSLAMKSALLNISLQDLQENPSPSGIDDIEFLISTNPGQPPKALSKVASGGELSRISLAIQVAVFFNPTTAVPNTQGSTTPSLVFDEVDVGIGGATADIVGKLLRSLGERSQVLCVTHLPQVASQAHQHLQVQKETNKKSAQSTLNQIDGDDKILEIARMLGGSQLTQQTIAHAREMLELAG